MKKKFAIVLAGCGNIDGSEITETVCLSIALRQLGGDVQFFAPQLNYAAKIYPQQQHLPIAMELKDQKRNTLLESARIARGEVRNLEELKESEFDAVVFTGGKGVAVHLSNWASDGIYCKILPLVERHIWAFHNASKPIAAVCIAPILLAKVLGKKGITITLGNDENLIREIEKTGIQHEVCSVEEYITDRESKVITSPAYMYDNIGPHQVFAGLSAMCKELYEMS